VAKLSKQDQGDVFRNYRTRVKAADAEHPTRNRIIDEDISAVQRVQVQEAFDMMPQSVTAAPEDPLRNFIERVSQFTKDGECHKCHSSEDENSECKGHHLFDMPNDHAVETLNGLIDDARKLLGVDK
jgi:hypothetical protein